MSVALAITAGVITGALVTGILLLGPTKPPQANRIDPSVWVDPGSYTWTVPAGISRVKIGTLNNSGGTIVVDREVVPGSTITVTVGK